MDPLFRQIQTVFHESPRLFIALMIICAVLGILFGYGILGPAIME
jgi:hypothetical protein